MKLRAIANAVFVIFVILKWINVIYAEELLKDLLQFLFLLFLVSVGFRVTRHCHVMPAVNSHSNHCILYGDLSVSVVLHDRVRLVMLL